MKNNHQAFEQFIMAQQVFFETALLPEVNADISDPNAHYSWETNILDVWAFFTRIFS
ncbi:hypothetical protein BKF98_RS22995 [Vibrio parahaemolyticus]|nr:hypothetical protein [Vibrio parahaemolyticus]